MNHKIGARWIAKRQCVRPKMTQPQRLCLIEGLDPAQVAKVRHLGNRIVGQMADGSLFTLHL